MKENYILNNDEIKNFNFKNSNNIDNDYQHL